MIAKVIVDVNTKKLDRPFDYQVPNHLVQDLELGMRVVVPFRNRKLMGFVVGLEETSEFDTLKPISSIMDLIPSLSVELLELSEYIQESTACNRIQSLLAMLPAAMKAKYDTQIQILNPKKLSKDLEKFFNGRSTLIMNDNLEPFRGEIRKLIASQDIDVSFLVKNQGNIKYKKMIHLNLSSDDYEDAIDELYRAPKQVIILEYLNSCGGVCEKSELLIETSSSQTQIRELIKKNYIEELKEEVYRDISFEMEHLDKVVDLHEAQKNAITDVVSSLEQQKSDVFVLEGVTGSGKTEVYLNIIEHVLKEGKEAIVLVPEISLTPQMIRRFKGRFGEQVAVLHSGLSIGEKYDEWRKILRGDAKVALGARSAVFAPFNNLGVIVIDEEHEGTYKQDTIPRYHARDVAKWRADYHKCPTILGSATPSLESYARASKGLYKLLELPERANQLELPSTKIIDLRAELQQGNKSIFSKDLQTAISNNLKKKEQIVLLLNRRGFSTFVLCRDCGEIIKCNNCDISLTYHKHKDKLVCHYCGFEKPNTPECPNCHSSKIRFMGTGTEKIEEEINTLWPEAKVIRMDNDTTSGKGMHEVLIKDFEDGKADILLGTQMIAKGLDFPNVTLVGILAADLTLNLPDFRASEKTFQLLTQVSGRAGRHDKKGNVFIQTYNPEHYAITNAAKHDFKSFYKEEMNIRKIGRYSPYYFIEQIIISHEQLRQVFTHANHVIDLLNQELSNDVILLGPTLPYVSRVKNHFRVQIIVKYRKEPNLSKAYKMIDEYFDTQDASIIIDRFPNNLL